MRRGPHPAAPHALHLDDPRLSIVLVSYQAPHVAGRAAAAEAADRAFPRPQVEQVGGGGLRSTASPATPTRTISWRCWDRRWGETGKMRLVHGEPPQAEALAAGLRGLGFGDVAVPHREEHVRVA